MDFKSTTPKINFPEVEIKNDQNAAREDDIYVELDLEIDADLKMEGWFRDLNRVIQDMRKELDLEYTDRIEVLIEGATEYLDNFYLNKWLMNEVFGTEVTHFYDFELKNCDLIKEIVLGDKNLTIGIKKV
jgi:hypothetical protein